MSLLIVAKSKEKSNGYFDIIDNPLVMKNFDDYNDEIEDNNNNNGITDEIDEDNNNNDEITDKRVDDDNNDGISDKIDKDNNNKDEITDEIDNDNDNDDITAETDDDTNNDGITDEIDEDNYNNNDITEEIDGDNYNNDERRNGNDASKCHESDTNECGQPNNFEQIKNFKSPEAVKLTDENLEEKNILIEDFKKPHKEKKRIKRGVNPIDGPISLKELKQVKINVPFKMGERDLYVTEYHHATLESEDRENRWKIPTCVTNLKELYTCIFCSKYMLPDITPYILKHYYKLLKFLMICKPFLLNVELFMLAVDDS
ncbi:hypothetical protein CDAR_287431 [Caerostris darwini]|uniref:Uncharacterized protein n=1 Tax=Caerostris darwini TaxID=1538125 RepID=A0AAV4X1N5_9ARAC|nr:hypothetical protein CDAR_287431 [Caerostris darwini]